MDRRKVEELFDKYAEGYSSGPFAPSRYDTSRAAMSFADDITWHFMMKYLPKDKSVRRASSSRASIILKWFLHLLSNGFSLEGKAFCVER